MAGIGLSSKDIAFSLDRRQTRIEPFIAYFGRFGNQMFFLFGWLGQPRCVLRLVVEFLSNSFKSKVINSIVI